LIFLQKKWRNLCWSIVKVVANKMWQDGPGVLYICAGILILLVQVYICAGILILLVRTTPISGSCQFGLARRITFSFYSCKSKVYFVSLINILKCVHVIKMFFFHLIRSFKTLWCLDYQNNSVNFFEQFSFLLNLFSLTFSLFLK